MIARLAPLLAPLLLVSAVCAQPAAHASDSWRRLQVRVRSDLDGRSLPGARVEVDVLGAPVWEAPRQLRTDASGLVDAWVPRWGGPIRVTAVAVDHLPAMLEVGADVTATLDLPYLPRGRNRVRLGLEDDAGTSLQPLVLPTHAMLVVRAHGTLPDPEVYATWMVPAREAFQTGVDLPTGACDLAIRAAAWVPAWTRVFVPDDLSPTLKLPERSLSPLVVRVVDAATREPVAGAIVRYDGWGDGQIRTDASGEVTIPFLPAEGAPDDLSFEWSLSGWVRTRWYGPEVDESFLSVWLLGMHRAATRGVSVVEADGSAVVSGVAWTTGGPWIGQRWAVTNGRVEVGLPADGVDGDMRVLFASPKGFALLDAATLRTTDRVALRPWRRVRAYVDRAGEDCPGTCQVGLHLLASETANLRPGNLAPWLWTAPISASGEIDTVVPEGADAVLQVDVGRRTAFFGADGLWREASPVLRLGPESEADSRTLLLLGPDASPRAGVDLGLRSVPPGPDPRPLGQLYEGTTDEEGLLRHYGPRGPYEVWELRPEGNRRLTESLTYDPNQVGIVRQSGVR